MLAKSGSTSVLLGGSKKSQSNEIGQNKGLVLKMLRNFDIDQTGLVSTVNLSKVFKLMGFGGLETKVRFTDANAAERGQVQVRGHGQVRETSPGFLILLPLFLHYA